MSQPAATPKQPMSTRKKVIIGVAIVVCAPPFIAGAISGAEHPNGTSTHAAAAATTPKPGHTQAAAKPAHPATTRSTAPHTSPPTVSAAALAHLTLQQRRVKAAAILKADDTYYDNEFQHGVTVSLDRGQAGSFTAYHSWQSKASTDIQPGTAAFQQADAYFNATNEPSAINDWRDDNGNLQSDLFTLANDSLDAGGPGDAEARTKIQADIRQEQKDLAAAQRDAANVAAGR